MSLHSIDLQRVTEITQEERSWALNIKAAVEEAGDIQNVSDFEYVHHAFVARDNIGSAVERIRGLQFFREEYHINDTVEEGMELIHAFLAQQPKWLLTVDIDPEKGHFVYVYDNARLRPYAVDEPEDWRIHLGGLYYCWNALHSNILACREGVVHICECEGMKGDNFSMKHIRRIFSDLGEHYPFRHKEISWIRTPLAANLLYSFMKPLMRKDTRYKFQTGCNFYGYTDRLDGIFHIPNVEVAEHYLQNRLQDYLKTRYYLEQNYRIP